MAWQFTHTKALCFWGIPTTIKPPWYPVTLEVLRVSRRRQNQRCTAGGWKFNMGVL